MKKDQAEITSMFPARFENLAAIVDFVATIAQQAGFSEKDVYAIQIAVDEACSNIIEHAYEGNNQGQIRCSCLAEKTALTITLCDQGLPFNPREIPQPNFSDDLEQRQIGGLGLYFMHQLMDEVTFQSIPSSATVAGRNQVVMVKRMSRAEANS
jgi:serine/threonine-protein kinase RsbW